MSTLRTPLGGRLLTAAVLFICGAVVLGISIHVEHSARLVGVRSHTFTYDAFVGAYTVLFETLFVILRLALQKHVVASLATEMGFAVVTWVFWLAGAIDTTLYTDGDRAICRHLDDLFDLEDFKDVPADVLAAVKKVFKSACSELHAQLAFLWIGFVVITIWTAYNALLLWRLRRQGTGKATQVTLRSYQGALHTHQDPFVDPVGNFAGPSVGVARDEEDPDYKP